MLGFELSERTISRWMKRAPRDPDRAECWPTFLRNHREAIAAMDFFTVPTITFGVLYCFFVISHDRRRILHINVTKHPTSGWITQQLREAFPLEASLKYLIFDRDRKFGFEVITAGKPSGSFLNGLHSEVPGRMASRSVGWEAVRSKLGAPKAITAMAHMLARLVYRMLKFGHDYMDRGIEFYEAKYHSNGYT
jgi:hypothetical protein